MVIAANLGFSRMGSGRELKKALESYWKGEIKQNDLEHIATSIRKNHWLMQKHAGIEHIPSNDFSYYDHVLDTIAMTGSVPDRYEFKGAEVDLATYFAMARGSQGNKDHAACSHLHHDLSAMEMTKWFDTNYHYIVPEFTKNQDFKLKSLKAVREYEEAKNMGIETRPVLLGPVSFLLLGKMKDGGEALSLLPKLLPVYCEIINKLASSGAYWIQIDEPCLVLDLSKESVKAFEVAYSNIKKECKDVKILLATYFDDCRSNLDTAFSLPVAGIHIDLVRAPEQLTRALKLIDDEKLLSLGLIDGRNIWKTDLDKALKEAEVAVKQLSHERVMIAGSCSLLHTPVDLDLEKKLDNEQKSWLAFAKQKLEEIVVISTALEKGRQAVEAALKSNSIAIRSRRSSSRIHNQTVKERVEKISKDMLNRKNPYDKRRKAQIEALDLPLLPTTTIGSFPQTQEVRNMRAQFKKGSLPKEEYDAFLAKEIESSVKFQEEIGIDVLVHGEFERNDMVEYFGERLNGFMFTEHGWVQSYGSRCVKPPIIFGDISRMGPMTVKWSGYAQSLTKKLMKGMLTGPVTILQWSFVRDDQPRSVTCKQIGLAIRDEVVDLEKAGIKVIQIDEPAIREGLPLHNNDRADYLKWAVDSFRLSASGVKDETQIHTHMCYSEFNDIIKSIADMDADVISIETSRSQMELLEAFVGFKYPNEIGPGVYDIHSPRVPSKQEMSELLEKALKVLSPEQVWVNPDCGLKTRGWKEVKPALELMVAAAKQLRQNLKESGKLKQTA